MQYPNVTTLGWNLEGGSFTEFTNLLRGVGCSLIRAIAVTLPMSYPGSGAIRDRRRCNSHGAPKREIARSWLAGLTTPIRRGRQSWVRFPDLS